MRINNKLSTKYCCENVAASAQLGQRILWILFKNFIFVTLSFFMVFYFMRQFY